MARSTDRPAMTIAVDLGRKATNKQTNKYQYFVNMALKVIIKILSQSVM